MFTKVTNISNVTHVENYWHQLVIWENTSKSFTKFMKNTNVILVENHLLYQIQWKPSTKIRKISYVALVENYLRSHIKTLHEGHKHFKCDSCRKSFTLLPNLTIVNRTINYWNLRGHIKTIHECHKDYKNGATSLRIHIKTIHEAEDLKDFDLIGNKALAKEIKCQLFFL